MQQAGARPPDSAQPVELVGEEGSGASRGQRGEGGGVPVPTANVYFNFNSMPLKK